jgi:hypothetical protein
VCIKHTWGRLSFPHEAGLHTYSLFWKYTFPLKRMQRVQAGASVRKTGGK